MNKFDYPTNKSDKQDIDLDKEKKFDEFIRVYLLNGEALTKSNPNSVRSILAKKRTLKLKKNLYE